MVDEADRPTGAVVIGVGAAFGVEDVDQSFAEVFDQQVPTAELRLEVTAAANTVQAVTVVGSEPCVGIDHWSRS